MNARQTWVLGTTIVLAALIFGAYLGPRSAAQQGTPPAALGRYQAIPCNGQDGQFVVIDTATGHCWSKVPGELGRQNDWTDQGVPPSPRK